MADVDVLSIRNAQVAMEGVTHIDFVLLEYRAVEPERMTQLCPLLFGRIAAGNESHRIAARMADDEGQERDAQQYRQSTNQLAERDRQHGARPSRLRARLRQVDFQ